jgi:predicted PurR-regulated permease PerM
VDTRAPSPAQTLRIVAIVFAVLIALRFLWIAHAIFIVAFLGIIAGLALSKATDWLERHRVRRALGAPATLIAVLALLIAIGTWTAPTVKTQLKQLTAEAPQTLRTLEERFGLAQKDNVLIANVGKELRGLTKFLFPVISSVLGAVAGIVIILFIAVYIAAQPDLYREGILHLIPKRGRPRAEETLDTLRDTLRQWLLARLMAMVIIGTLTGIALGLMRVKGAAALGLLAGVMELIPFFGPFISAIPAIGIALVDSPQKALGVVALYVVMQQLEGNVITPIILEKRLDIPPVLTVISVSAMSVVFGVIGMLIAEPLLAATLVVAKMLYVQDVVGDDVTIGKHG